MTLRPLVDGDIARCREILATLGDWFGLPDANEAYFKALQVLPAAVISRDDRILGLAAVEETAPGSIEVHVMAVDRAAHRSGLGAELMAWCERAARERAARWLHLKTRGPTTWDDGYERTRQFYEAQGFERLFESLTEWGSEDAALVYVKRLD